MVGGHSTDGDNIDGVFDDFGVALALLGLFFGVSEGVGVFAVALGVRFMLDFGALVGAIGGFSTNEIETQFRGSISPLSKLLTIANNTIAANTSHSYAHRTCFAYRCSPFNHQARVGR